MRKRVVKGLAIALVRTRQQFTFYFVSMVILRINLVKVRLDRMVLGA
jgi:hypothetical protein